MKKTQTTLLLVFTLCLTLTTSTLVPHQPPIINHVPRTYKISLDDTPQQRWAQIIKDYKVPLEKFMNAFDELRIPDKFLQGVEFFAKNIYQHKDFVAEVAAVAKLSGFQFDKLFFLNFMYEYSTACTAVLVCNSEGKVLHGRNLDFPMWGHLANLLVRGEYYKGGKKVFTSDFIVGSVIALTGSKPGAFSINVDTRTAKNFDQDLISVLADGAIPTCWLVQRVLIEEPTYDSAVKRLKSTRIGGPVYYIVSGVNPYEGIVIEREVNSTHASYELSQERWFLVQTNYDRDQPDPKIDERRIPAEKRVQQKGNKLTQQELLDQVMVMWPNFNIETIMSTIMVASTGYHNTTAWYGANPAINILREQ